MPNEIEILNEVNRVYEEKQIWRPFRGLTLDCEGSNEEFQS